jgi:hypothetical protein
MINLSLSSTESGARQHFASAAEELASKRMRRGIAEGNVGAGRNAGQAELREITMLEVERHIHENDRRDGYG